MKQVQFSRHLPTHSLGDVNKKRWQKNLHFWQIQIYFQKLATYLLFSDKNVLNQREEENDTDRHNDGGEGKQI